MLLIILLLLMPLWFMVWYIYSNKLRHIIVSIVIYIVLMVFILIWRWYDSEVYEIQIMKLENMIIDYDNCMYESETVDDLDTCYKLLERDAISYGREYNNQE